MKKFFNIILNSILLFVMCTTFFACSNSNLNKDNSDEQESSVAIEDKVEPTVIKLTKYNYNSYLNIFINQTAQTQTLISNTYYVKYRYGNSYEYRYYTGLTPPTTNDVLQCVYLYSKYSVSTTFSINCQSKNKNYIFSNCNFSIVYRASPSQSSCVTIYVSQDGAGNNIFMMTEELSKPNKAYSLQANNMISDFNGELLFFNGN